MKSLITFACLGLALAQIARADLPNSISDWGMSTSAGTVWIDEKAEVSLGCSNDACTAVEFILNAGMWILLSPVNLTALTGGGLSTDGNNDPRAAYITTLRDDAAEYVAADAPVSAILRDAIDRIRAENKTAAPLDDKAVAAGILH
jgi:hypothetical protein